MAARSRLGQRWWATRGGGSFTSRPVGRAPRRLQVSAGSTLLAERVLTLPGFGNMEGEQQGAVARMLGGTPADEPWSHQLKVAEGVKDLAIWFGGDVWDHAAPSIIVEEAGGRFSDHQGGHRLDTRTAIYSNGLLHDEILASLVPD